jgi:hypothetical protein
MAHPSRDELLAIAESPGPVPAGHHVAACEACRREIAAMRALLADVREVPVPEPSPLFWDHLSARVRDAVSGETPGERADAPVRHGLRGLRAALRWPMAVASTAAMALVLLVVTGRDARSPNGVPAAPVPGAAGEATDTTPIENGELAGEDWAFVADAAESVTYDEVSRLSDAVGPGAAESVITRLTSDEQRELVKLIEAELGRHGTS